MLLLPRQLFPLACPIDLSPRADLEEFGSWSTTAFGFVFRTCRRGRRFARLVCGSLLLLLLLLP